MAKELFAVLRTTASDLQAKLDNGTLTTVEIVETYLDQIEQHDHKGANVNAIIALAPHDQLLEFAATLDHERQNGLIRGPLHGIPILVKDNIMTEAGLGMATTCDAYALKGVMAKKSADVADQVLAAGMIILGKTNPRNGPARMVTCFQEAGLHLESKLRLRMSLAASSKEISFLTMNCCSSSSSSAAGVAAGFAPLALGTETDGSITQPAGRCSLYGMKVTVGAVSTAGTSPYSPFSDSVGAMAKTSGDLAQIIGLLMKKAFSRHLSKSWKGQKIAFVDQSDWPSSPVAMTHIPEIIEKQARDIVEAAALIEKQGAKVVCGVKIPTYTTLAINGKDAIEPIWNHDFPGGMAEFLDGYIDPPVKTVSDIVEFNLKHPAEALTEEFPNGQAQLEDTLLCSISDGQYEEHKKFIRLTATTNGFDKVFKEQDVDLVVSLLDCRLGSMAAAAGYPSATVPLGYADTFNGRAYGLNVISVAGGEDKIFEFMSAWEASHLDLWQPPPQLVKWRGVPSAK